MQEVESPLRTFYFSLATGSSSTYSNTSPGVQSSALQMASSVVNRTALALPVFSIDRLAAEMPIFSANSPDDILRFAIITSMFTTIIAVSSFLF